METVRSFFFKPDPAAQLRKCNSLIRTNARSLNSHYTQLNTLELKTKNAIVALSKRKTGAGRDTSSEMRMLARELVRIRRQKARIATSKAQLESVGMQVKEAFAIRKIEGSIKASTEVMRNVNSLLSVPEMMGTMRELGEELVKAGVIEEMVGDMLPDAELEEDEEEMEEEMERVIGEIVGKKTKVEEKKTEVGVGAGKEEEEEEVRRMRERLEMLKGAEVEEEEDDEVMLGEMRRRLEELKS